MTHFYKIVGRVVAFLAVIAIGFGSVQPVFAVTRTAPAPAGPTKLCQFDCILEHNIWTGTHSDGPQRGQACSCIVKYTESVRPQTGGGDRAFSCNADTDCQAHCRTTCGSMGGTCYAPGPARPLPACATRAPDPGCSGPSTSAEVSGQVYTCATVAAAGAGSASSRGRGSSAALSNPLGNGTTLFTIAARVIRGVIGIVGSIALLMFIYGGLRWMTAGGSEEGVKTARSILTNSAIGLMMIFFSYTVISIFLSAFNLPRDTPVSEQVPATPPPAARDAGTP